MQAIVRRLEAHGITDARRYYPWESKREFNEFLLGDGPISMEQLLENGYATFSYELGDFDRVGFKTYTGKIELFSEKLAELGLDPLPDYIPPHVDQTLEVTRQEYPLTLLTGVREKTYHHSRFRDQVWARKVSNDPWLQMNPETAEKYGLLENDWVVVETIDHNGQCRLRVRVTEDVLPDVLRTGMGWWYPEAAGPEFGSLDININAAIAYDGLCDPVTGSVDTRGIRCRLTKTNIATAGE